MRIGIVCPYSLDRPGGVQLHVTSLAEALIERGHYVSVIAPAAPETVVPDYVYAAGRSIPISYNGSTARLTFGLTAAARVRRWLREGEFDVVHIHEPGVPSLSILALWARLGPTVGTFHTAMDESNVMKLAKPWIKPGFEELDARIAVSPSASRTLYQHLRLEPTHIIPNGVYTQAYRDAESDPRWVGTVDAPTIGILGRMDEPRKGLDTYIEAIPLVRKKHPHARFVVAGRFSDRTAARIARAGGEVIGELDEDEKARFMASVDIYCAPNTGGESFGIVLVEAMAAGAAVVASDLVAFMDVADGGTDEPAAIFHRVGDATDLSRAILELIDNTEYRKEISDRGRECALSFDWDNVAPRVEATYLDAIRMDAEFHPPQAKEEHP